MKIHLSTIASTFKDRRQARKHSRGGPTPPSVDNLRRQLMYAAVRMAQKTSNDQAAQELHFLSTQLSDSTSFLTLTINDLREENK